MAAAASVYLSQSKRNATKTYEYKYMRCKTMRTIFSFYKPVSFLCVHPGSKAQRLILRLYSPLKKTKKKHTTCLSCNKALNVSSLDWSQG